MRNYERLFPSTYSRLVEPFVGSASVFFGLAPSKALLADSNNALIETFDCLKSKPDFLVKSLKKYQQLHSDDFYYVERNRVRRRPHTRAAQFLYLNRTCWNGLYRVNKKGIFNVPRGTKNDLLYDIDLFDVYSKQLNKAEILNLDYLETLKLVRPGDFLFVDPPYTVKHNNNGFIKYNENIFCWNSQITLRNRIRDLQHYGIKVLVTNANHPSIHELYSGIGEMHEVKRMSVISGQNAGRSTTTELAITINYSPTS